jgi:hypothetical protein
LGKFSLRYRYYILNVLICIIDLMMIFGRDGKHGTQNR